MPTPQDTPRDRTGLPFIRDVTIVYRLTWLTAVLLLASSVAGLLYGPRGWYDPETVTFPALLGQDAITLVFALPLLLVSAWLARRGSMRGLLCWLGALFYIAYFYYFYIVGIRFNALFSGYIALVSMSMYSVVALLFALDLKGVKARFNERTPVRLIGGFLIGTSLAFTVLWLALIVSNLAAGTELEPVLRFVIAIDGVVLLPLSFWGGLWLWRREPVGYALAGLLLVKLVATFLTLIVTTVISLRWGLSMDPLQTLMYSTGMIGALALLVRYLRSVDAPSTLRQTDALIDRFIPVADIAESHEILIHAPADVVFHVAENFDLQSIPIVRAIFSLHATLFRVRPPKRNWAQGSGCRDDGAGLGFSRMPSRQRVGRRRSHPTLGWQREVQSHPGGWVRELRGAGPREDCLDS